MNKRMRLVSIVLLLVHSACTGSSGDTDQMALARWRLGPEPVVSIGHEEDPAYSLYRVRQARTLDSGPIAVTHGFEEVRLFSADGVFLRVMGGRGQGPGEFTQLWTIHPIPGDSVFAVNSYPARASLFGPTGRFVRSFDVEEHGTLVDRLDDGSWIGLQQAGLDLPGVDQVFERHMFVIHYSSRGSVLDTVTTLADSRLFGSAAGYVGAPFSPSAYVAVQDDKVYVAEGDQPGVTVHDIGAGSTSHTVLRDISRRAVTDAMIDEYVGGLDSPATEPGAGASGQFQATDLLFPDSLPAISGLLVDDTGRIWIRRYGLPTESQVWHIYSAAGAIATIEVPRSFRLTEIRSGLVLGVWSDELGVQTVRQFRVLTN